MTTLETTILGIIFENPFILASAPPTASIESIDKAFDLGWGGAVLKTISPENLEMKEASPRFTTLEFSHKTIGFQNIELLSHKKIADWCDGIKYLKEKHPTKVIIASIMAPVERSAWQSLVLQLNETPIDAFELNFSCPHGMPEKNIGMAIGTSAEISILITSWVREVAKKPFFVKLTPNITDITSIAKAVEIAGANGISAINTVQGFMGIDLETLEPKLNIDGKTTYGGCSGAFVKPIGLKCVSQIRKSSNLPILGIGGISTWEDAAEYIMVGSNAVQVCTGVMLNGYGIIDNLKNGLLEYMESKNFETIEDMRNLIVNKITTHESLNKIDISYPNIDKDKCVKCGKCAQICSESGHKAMKMTRDGIEVLKNKCEGCSLCKYVCPKSAIYMSCSKITTA
ncbi:MAG: NAD-dependent dihydropyrimidine dehydrogenase subunit PreA [bacterium]|nr:NAD-dependent dihydropyrimidine dehydrogenase subunit PreA [bacterium]